MMRTPILLAAMGGLCCGCAGVASGDAGPAAGPRSLFLRLTASRLNAGEIGTAILVPHENATDVTIEISGGPLGTTSPVHLYTFIYAGRCAKLSPKPAYVLTEHVLADSPSAPGRMTATIPPFRVSNTAPVKLATLRDTPHAIQVRTAPADGDLAIFCGDIAGE